MLEIVTRFHVVDAAGYPLCRCGGVTEFAETHVFGEDWSIECDSEEEADELAAIYGGNVEAFQCLRQPSVFDLRRSQALQAAE